MATQIQLNQISFDTLPSFAIENSQVWNQTININKGEQVLVSAPSGKGKSSFISLLYGLRRDYTGYYKIDGVDTAQFSAARWSDFRSFEASIVFQDLRLLMDYSVWDNLALKGKLTGGGTKCRNNSGKISLSGPRGVI
jgi:ABC-type lipoprotein export system ATPase subunit